VKCISLGYRSTSSESSESSSDTDFERKKKKKNKKKRSKKNCSTDSDKSIFSSSKKKRNPERRGPHSSSVKEELAFKFGFAKKQPNKGTVSSLILKTFNVNVVIPFQKAKMYPSRTYFFVQRKTNWRCLIPQSTIG
jgi:hypothetical protein